MQKKRIDFRIEEQTLEEIKKMADKEGRTLSGMIRKVLEDYAKKNEWSTQITGVGPITLDDTPTFRETTSLFNKDNISLGEIVNFIVDETNKQIIDDAKARS